MQNKSQWSLLIIKGTLEYSFKYFVYCMLCLNALYTHVKKPKHSCQIGLRLQQDVHTLTVLVFDEDFACSLFRRVHVSQKAIMFTVFLVHQ